MDFCITGLTLPYLAKIMGKKFKKLILLLSHGLGPRALQISLALGCLFSVLNVCMHRTWMHGFFIALFKDTTLFIYNLFICIQVREALKKM